MATFEGGVAAAYVGVRYTMSKRLDSAEHGGVCV